MSTEVILTSLPEEVNPKGTDLTYVVDTVNNLSKFSKLENLPISTNTQTALNSKQPTLVSGTNIKTINSNSLLGSGDVAVQETLVSGVSLKTVNSTSLLGAGDIPIPIVNPSGVSGAIQFSDGSAFASDAANLFWDDTNNRLGVGTNTPSTTLNIVGQTTFSDNALFSADFKYIGRDLNNSSIRFSDASREIRANISTGGQFQVYNSGTGSGRLTVTSGGQTTISGGGSTSATTSLLVQNSTGSNALQVRDDRVIIMAGLPTSSSGLPSGALWNDAGTLKIA